MNTTTVSPALEMRTVMVGNAMRDQKTKKDFPALDVGTTSP